MAFTRVMRRAALFLLAAYAVAIPTHHLDLRPLERDLRDMEVAIEALHAKAAHKALRLERTQNKIQVVMDGATQQDEDGDSYNHQFYVQLDDENKGNTVAALKQRIKSAQGISKPLVIKNSGGEVMQDSEELEDKAMVFLGPVSLPSSMWQTGNYVLEYRR